MPLDHAMLMVGIGGLALAALCVANDYRHRRGIPIADVIRPEREPVG